MQYVEANGARIPAIGLGTMTLKEDVCVNAVKTALELGYRHIDTADYYGNEVWVGEGLHAGLRSAGLKREDVFLVTKVWFQNLAADDFARSVEASLKKLDVPSLDLLLIHWPNTNIPLAETIGALCKAKRDGFTRHIGVANFTTKLIDDAVKLSPEPIVTNQIEVHPFLDQTKVINKCREHGIAITAYCPAARGKTPGHDLLDRIGKAHGRSSTQVALRYLVQNQIIPIPRTATPAHLAENLAVFDFTLSPAEMAEIGALKRPDGRIVSPPHAPQWDN